MDEAAGTSGPGVGEGGQRAPEEIRRDIERTREQLGETVEELAAQTDVKRRAQAKAEDVKTRARSNAVPMAAVGGALVAVLVAHLVLKRR